MASHARECPSRPRRTVMLPKSNVERPPTVARDQRGRSSRLADGDRRPRERAGQHPIEPVVVGGAGRRGPRRHRRRVGAAHRVGAGRARPPGLPGAPRPHGGRRGGGPLALPAPTRPPRRLAPGRPGRPRRARRRVGRRDGLVAALRRRAAGAGGDAARRGRDGHRDRDQHRARAHGRDGDGRRHRGLLPARRPGRRPRVRRRAPPPRARRATPSSSRSSHSASPSWPSPPSMPPGPATPR